MTDLPGNSPSWWDRLRGHALFRAGAVFGSAVFFILQILDLLGLPASAIRALAILSVTGFVAGEVYFVWKSRKRATATLAPERIRRWVLRGHRWAAAALALLILGGSAWLLGRRLIDGPVRPGTEVIAVMPFVASGDDVEDLRIGMVSLLTTNLDQVGGIRTIDAGTVLHSWSRRATGGTLDLQSALEVGRNVGAGAILWGSVAAVREAVQVTGEIYTVDGQRVAHREERGDVDELQAVIDRLTVELLREIWRADAPVPDLRIAAITTQSPRALRTFLRGERYMRAAKYDSAVASFEEAVRTDSTFALAYFRLSESYGWSTHFGSSQALRAAEAADRLAERLPERERSLAVAQLLHERGDLAALDTVRAITVRHPDDALAWYLLGDALVHSRAMIAPTQEELVTPFRRAVQLDPTPGGGMIHMLEEALVRGDRALFDEFLGHYRAAAGPERATRWQQLARVRWVPPDSLMALVSEVGSLFVRERAPPSYMSRIELVTSTRFGMEPELDPGVLIAAQEAFATSDFRPGALRSRAFALAELGRVREASALLDTLASTPGAAPDLPPPFFMRAIWAAMGLYPADSLPPQIALAPRDSFWSRNVDGVLRMFHLGRGDLRAADSIPRPAAPPDTVGDANVRIAMMMALDAHAQILRGDTAGGVAKMRDAIRRAGYSVAALRPFGSGPLFNYALALSRRAETRAEGIRRLRAHLYVGSGFVVKAFFALAEALEAEGDLAGAAEAYAHVLRLWKNADPHLQTEVRRAADALARLTRETGGNGEAPTRR